MTTKYRPFSGSQKAVIGRLEELAERMESIDEKMDRILENQETNGYRSGHDAFGYNERAD